MEQVHFVTRPDRIERFSPLSHSLSHGGDHAVKSVRSEMFRNDSFRTEPMQTESSRNESPSKRKLSTRILSKRILPNRTHADRILSKRIPLEANPPDTHTLDTNSREPEPPPRVLLVAQARTLPSPCHLTALTVPYEGSLCS